MALTWSSLRFGAFVLLAGAGAALGIAIYSELADNSAPEASAPPAAPQAATMPPPEAFALPPLQSYSAVTERPLFSPGRKPAPPELSSQPATNVSEFVLSGIVITDNEKVALIADAHAGSLARYREGQIVGGWKLTSIEQDRIVLERGATRQEIKLTDKSRAAVEGVPQPRPPIRR